MKKLILASLAVLALVPSTAMAQSAADMRHDRHDVREEQRDVRDARREVREERHDVRDARRDLRHEQRELRDARWDYSREVRDYNRAHPWKANFRYHRFTAGARIQPAYYGSRYVVVDHGRFHWAKPGVNQRWVRHYDDALLINTRTGRVVKVIYNAFR
ncbi:MAG: RcnB family protein [Sphingomonadales bacterium]|nr:RcnB family protein [Sphingomonadales bacterium]